MEEIDLREIFYIIRKRIWILILITIVFSVTSGILSFFVLEVGYSTFTTLMLGKPNDYSLEYNDVLLNQKLVSTYGELAKSNLVTNEVKKNLNLDMMTKSISYSVNVSLVKNTEIIKITVNSNNPEFAARIANETASVFIKHVSVIMKIDNVQVLDIAQLPVIPVKPKPMLNITIACFLGVIISIFIIFLLEYLDNTIKTPDEIKKLLELPIIGMIPYNK